MEPSTPRRHIIKKIKYDNFPDNRKKTSGRKYLPRRPFSTIQQKQMGCTSWVQRRHTEKLDARPAAVGAYLPLPPERATLGGVTQFYEDIRALEGGKRKKKQPSPMFTFLAIILLVPGTRLSSYLTDGHWTSCDSSSRFSSFSLLDKYSYMASQSIRPGRRMGLALRYCCTGIIQTLLCNILFRCRPLSF